MVAVTGFMAGLRAPETPPESIHSFGALLYHGVHFERAGRPLYLLTSQAARYLVDGVPTGVPRPIDAAGYLQLPQHLFWAQPTPERAESVDGIHWTVTGAGVLHTMIVTGLHDERPGLCVVALPEAPLDDADQWLRADVRDGEADFSTVLPGAELDRLYAFHVAGEVLKLLARFFAYVGSTPGALDPAEPGSGPPPPSELPHRRVTLG